MKLKEIEVDLKMLEGEELLAQIALYRQDERVGVQKLCDKYERVWKKAEEIKAEWESKKAFDTFFHEGEKILVGIDEVGRGPLAGPVVAAAVVLPLTSYLPGIKDSKKLSSSQRQALYDQIKEQALAIGVGIIDAQTIDEINILQATFEAMRQALSQIHVEVDVLLVDGDKIIPKVNKVQHAVIKGDNKSAAIAAASIIAKVTRDEMMKNYAKQYPHYEWESNKGYGSAKHYEGIKACGITPLHRKTFLKDD